MDSEEVKLLDAIVTPVFALEFDDDNRPVYVAFNSRAREIAKFALKDIIGKTAAEIYPGRLGQLAYERHCEAALSKQPISYEISLPLNRMIRQVRTHLRPVLDCNGHVIRLIGSSEDITNEAKLREVRTQSATLNKELEQFINMAAHDLRSPVKNVKYIAQALREDFQDLGDGKVEMIDMLERIATQSSELITDILAHAQATDIRPTTTEFNLRVLCTKIFAMLDPTEKQATNLQDQLISGDQTATQIVLRNLIDNAIKHNAPNAVKIAISAKDSHDGYFKIVVEDNGKGFSDSALKFLEGGKFRTDSGFGMLGIRRLIGARGGTIKVEKSCSTAGALISFSLPGSLLENANTAQTSHINKQKFELLQ